MRVKADVIAAASKRIDDKLASTATKPAAPPAPVVLSGTVKNYIAAARSQDDIGAYERAIGTNDLLSLYYFWAGLHASRPVGRIMIAADGSEPASAATGFLIAPNLMLTNHHVFENAEVAKRARIQFGFESDENGNERKSTWFSFDPDKFFINQEPLDYSLVYVDPATREGPDPLENFGWLRLNPRLGKTAYGQYLSIIQHPEAQAKQIAIRENQLLPFDDSDDFLTYKSDTFRGSSGSPVFNDFWEVVALHHMGKPAIKDGHYLDRSGNPILDHAPSEDEVQWIANEGARTSRIIADILKQAPQGELRKLLVGTFDGTVPEPGWNQVVNKAESAGLAVAPAAPAAAPPGTFLAYLPFNTTLRVGDAPVAVPPPPPPQQPAAAAPAPAEAFLEKLNFDDDYEDRSGYAQDFLGKKNIAPMPTITENAQDQIAPLKDKSGTQLDYHHFSVLVHAARRIPVLTAGNVDYSDDARGQKGRADFGKDQWVIDDRMDDGFQVPKGFYDRWKKLDYGHLVRREDNCWGGSDTEIEYANADTFHLTNCTPQHEAYNRANEKGLWGQLEEEIAKQSKRDKGLARLSIFAGPIFSDQDLVCDDKAGKILVPLSFWKVVIAPLRKGGIGAYGFILSQANVLAGAPPFEDFVPPDAFVHQQASLAAIEAVTIVRFAKALKDADAMAGHVGDGGEEKLTLNGLADLKLKPS